MVWGSMYSPKIKLLADLRTAKDMSLWLSMVSLLANWHGHPPQDMPRRKRITESGHALV